MTTMISNTQKYTLSLFGGIGVCLPGKRSTGCLLSLRLPCHKGRWSLPKEMALDWLWTELGYAALRLSAGNYPLGLWLVYDRVWLRHGMWKYTILRGNLTSVQPNHFGIVLRIHIVQVSLVVLTPWAIGPPWLLLKVSRPFSSLWCYLFPKFVRPLTPTGFLLVKIPMNSLWVIITVIVLLSF